MRSYICTPQLKRSGQFIEDANSVRGSFTMRSIDCTNEIAGSVFSKFLKKNLALYRKTLSLHSASKKSDSS